MNLKNKKGQTVTIFLVIGLIIIISALLIIILNREEAKEPLETGAGKAPEFAGQTELKNYVDECLQDSVLQGLEIMRLQGGYIEIPDGIETMLVKDEENKQVAIVDGVRKVVVNPNGLGNNVPYWLKRDSIAVPSIDLMEFHLLQHVAIELGSCIDDFLPFREQKFEIEYGEIEPEVEMESQVVVKIKFPITATKGEINIEIDEFIYTVPIDMEKIVTMATNIIGYETEFTFLEEHTQNLISIYSGLDAGMLPPYFMSISGTECNQVRWSKKEVGEKLKKIIEKNFEHLKIDNTKFERMESNDERVAGTYDSFIYRFFEEEYPSLMIDFSYKPEWNFNSYNIKPSSGDSIEPDSFKQKIPLVGKICVLEYSYKYTIDHGVLVEIEDDKSAMIDPVGQVYFNEKGYKFQYVIDNYLCGNQNRLCTGRPLYSYDFSNILEAANITELPQTMFCDKNQRTSSNITIKIVNSDNSSILPNIDIHYKCGSYVNDCFIGRTDENGILKSKFPKCINGRLYTVENDYINLDEALTVYNEPERTLVFELEPLKEIDIDIKKVDLKDYVRNYHETNSFSVDNSLVNLKEDEHVDITLNGPNTIFHRHPEFYNRKLKISSGLYNLGLNLYGKISFDKTEIYNGTIQKFNGFLPIGKTNIGWDIKKQEIKDKVTFFVLSNFDSKDVETFTDVNDNIMGLDGNLSAELLYKCVRKINKSTGREFCDYESCSFIDADGTNNIDFKDNTNNCEKAYTVEIKKEDYESFIRPRFE